MRERTAHILSAVFWGGAVVCEAIKIRHEQHLGPLTVELLDNPSPKLHSIKFSPDPDWNTCAMHVFSMFLLKLLCGIDDLAVLTSLVGTKSRRQNNINCALYLSFLSFIGMASWIVAQLTYSLMNDVLDDGFWNVEKVSAMLCGSILIMLGIKEYFDDDEDDEDETVGIEYESVADILEDKADSSLGKRRLVITKKPGGTNCDENNADKTRLKNDEDDEEAGCNEEDDDKDKNVLALGPSPSSLRSDVATEGVAPPPVSTRTSRRNGDFRYLWVILMLAVDDSVVFACMIQGTDINLVDVLLGMFLGDISIVLLTKQNCRHFWGGGVFDSAADRIDAYHYRSPSNRTHLPRSVINLRAESSKEKSHNAITRCLF
eukprot:jgi/Bigna1/145066/aug1.94_g19774